MNATTQTAPKTFAAGILSMSNLIAFDRDERVSAARRTLKLKMKTATELRAKVDVYQAPIFLTFGFTNDETGELLTNPEHLYLSEQDDLFPSYYAAMDDANRAHGFDVPAGHCPALIARHDQIRAENAALDLMGEVMGVDLRTATMEMRANALNLFLNPPGR